MKRDMALMRKILIAIEEWSADRGNSLFPDLGQPPEVVQYLLYQGIKGGLIEGECTEHSMSGLHCFVTRLTPAGHDFLDSARTPYIWDSVMADFKERGILTASFDAVKKALDAAIRKRLE
jgi:hypothetical protein